jgi:enoyl-CoA hydratase/carnithine racemase
VTTITKHFFTKVQVWREEGVGVIAINNPPLNTIDADVLDQLTAAATLAESDPHIEVIALTATGDTFFSSGVKWEMGSALDTLQAKAQVYTSIATSISKPVVAVLNAPALGAGLEISLLADFRLGTTTSYMGFPEACYGFPHLFAGPYVAKEVFGASIARRLFTLGDTLPPEDAYRLGLIDMLFERQNFLGEAKKWLGKLGGRGGTLLHIRSVSYDPLKLRYTFEVEKTAVRALISGGGSGADGDGLRRKREEVATLSPTLHMRLEAMKNALKSGGMGDEDTEKTGGA